MDEFRGLRQYILKVAKPNAGDDMFFFSNISARSLMHRVKARRMDLVYRRDLWGISPGHLADQ